VACHSLALRKLPRAHALRPRPHSKNRRDSIDLEYVFTDISASLVKQAITKLFVFAGERGNQSMIRLATLDCTVASRASPSHVAELLWLDGEGVFCLVEFRSSMLGDVLARSGAVTPLACSLTPRTTTPSTLNRHISREYMIGRVREAVDGEFHRRIRSMQ
jgi:hypothetical protein